MTIIKPHTNRSFVLFMSLFACLAVGGGVFLICEYNAIASMRVEVSGLKESMVGLQVANADLKERLFSMTTVTKLKEKGTEFGLTLERRPEYLNERQWLSDSSL
jgi:hypothetical protein